MGARKEDKLFNLVDKAVRKSIDNAIEEYNKERRGEKINFEKPIIKEFSKFLNLSDEKLDDLYEEVHSNLDEYENNSFWDDFAEKMLERLNSQSL